jgi:hypothetical protein
MLHSSATWVFICLYAYEGKPSTLQANKNPQVFGLEDHLCIAEREGFEPSVPARSTTVFETAPIDHSGISPGILQK